MLSKDEDGNLVETATRLYDPEYSRRRRINWLAPVLKSAGRWKEGRVGLLNAVLLDAAEVLDSLERLAVGGTFLYESG
jgi:hypothetical protein